MNTAFKRALAAGAIAAALPLATGAGPAAAIRPAEARAGCSGGGAVPADGRWHHYRANRNVTGQHGYRQSYQGEVRGDIPLVAIQLKGYENGKVVWSEIGVQNGPWSGRVAWGDNRAAPEIRAVAIGTGATITFSC